MTSPPNTTPASPSEKLCSACSEKDMMAVWVSMKLTRIPHRLTRRSACASRSRCFRSLISRHTPSLDWWMPGFSGGIVKPRRNWSNWFVITRTASDSLLRRNQRWWQQKTTGDVWRWLFAYELFVGYIALYFIPAGKRQAMHVAIQMPHAACWGLCPQSPLNAEFYSAATRSLNAFLLLQR